MLKRIAFAVLLMAAGSARADNTAEICWLPVAGPGPGVSHIQGRWAVSPGSVCYNHSWNSVHESHIRERCNNAYVKCAQTPGGCFSDSFIGGGREAPECSNHDGAAYPIVGKSGVP